MTAVSPVTKAARQAQIADILTRTRVRSQEELADLLAQRGVKVAQATLSRDLDELGAVRLRGTGGGLVYALPGEPGGPGSRPGGVAAGIPVKAGGAGAPGGAGGASQAGAAAGGDASVGASEGGDVHGGPLRSTPAGVRGGLGPRGVGGHSRLFAEAAADQPDRLTRVAADLLVSAEASANLVVLRTPAGGAQLLASAIDHAGWAAILGTVAGDDTVLVITRDPAGGDQAAQALLRLAERRV
jgi:transcriptional regulator of arginine metabolism